MPRSPPSQLPAGRLCNTWVRPLVCPAARQRFPVEAWGRDTRPLEAWRRRPRSDRGKSISLNSMVRLAANWAFPSPLLIPAAQSEQSHGGRRVIAAFGERLEFVDRVDFGTHRDVGHRSSMISTTTGTLNSSIHLCACSIAGRSPPGVHADRLAAQALDHRDMIDAVALELRGVDVVEGQLHAVVHVEAALGLADQARGRRY